jgi:hypothetical protein
LVDWSTPPIRGKSTVGTLCQAYQAWRILAPRIVRAR